MGKISGSLDADGFSSLLKLDPGQLGGFSCFVSGGQKFEGRVLLEASRNGGLTFEPVYATDGTKLDFTGPDGAELTGAVAGKTIENTNAVPMFCRVRAEAVNEAEDAVNYRVFTWTPATTKARLFDLAGTALIFQRVDGSLVAQMANQPGAYVDVYTDGTQTHAIDTGVYETRFVSGASAGNELATIGAGTGIKPGHRKLLTFLTRTNASDRIKLDHANILNASGTQTTSVTLDSAAGYILLEWTGAKWKALYSSGATLST